jgi:small subunit ribosomal protein S11
MANANLKSKKKIRKQILKANVYVTASYNNTLITVTDSDGKTLAWSSAGGCGFKGSRKSTPYAATVTAEKLVEKIVPYGIESVKVFIKGVGTGREQAIRGLIAAGLNLEAVFDVTPVPHNGCRKKKARRV